MSNCFNSVTVIGHLGNDPLVIAKKDQTSFTTLQIALNESWQKDQVKHTRTDWFTVMLNGQLAKVAERYLTKGSKVLIHGKLRTQQWQDKETEKNRSTVVIMAQEIHFLSAKSDVPATDSVTNEANNSAPIATDETMDTLF